MQFLAAQSLNAADIVILVFILVFVVYGLIRGFLKQIMGFISSIAALVIAYIFCAKVADYIIQNTSIGTTLSLWIRSLIGEAWDVDASVSELSAFIQAQNWPSFLSQAVIDAVENLGSSTVNFAEVASFTLSRYILIALSFLVISAAAKLVLFIIEKILAFIIKRTPIVIVDRILGAVLAVVKCAILINLILFLIGIFAIEPLKEVQAAIEQSPIANFFMTHNLFAWLLGLIA